MTFQLSNQCARLRKPVRSQPHHPGAQELITLEKTTMQTPGAVYDALRRNGDVAEWIERMLEGKGRGAHYIFA